MPFDRSRNVDASRSTFNDVGNNQTTINLSISGSGHILHLHSGDTLSPASRAETTIQKNIRTPISHVPEVYTATGLIVNIVQLLIDCRGSSDEYHALQVELKSLQQTLVLTDWAIGAYEYTPLGPNLANTINSEVERCCMILQEMLDDINRYRQGLVRTSIGGLWPHVWRSGWDENTLASLRKKSSACRDSLNGFLMALASVAWMDLGNELHTGNIPLKKIHASLRQSLSSERHIKVHTVLVVNHLGENIPVPTLFCSRWKDFHYIINGYCKDRIGNRFIERGDYHMIRAEDQKTIDPSEFTSTVKVGMVFEMSIVLRQDGAFEDNKRKCPQCHHINRKVTINSGWIIWKVFINSTHALLINATYSSNCSKQFQVVKAAQDDDSGPDGDEGGDKESHEENSLKGDRVEEVISPASQKSGSHTRRRAYSDEDRGQYDSTRSFRRIHLICMDSDNPARFPNLRNTEPLRVGLLWYLNVHTDLPYRWQRCQASLYPDTLRLSWIAPGGGHAIVTLDLLNCSEVRSIPSPMHPSAREDIGTIAAREQSADPHSEPLIELLCPIQLLYSDGVERLAAESARERVRWVSALWEALDRSVTISDRSRSPSPTVSVRMAAPSEASSASGSTLFLPPHDAAPDLSDIQSFPGSDTESDLSPSSSPTSVHTHMAGVAAVSSQYSFPGDRRVIASRRRSSLSSQEDLDEEFTSAVTRPRSAQPARGFGQGLAEGCTFG